MREHYYDWQGGEYVKTVSRYYRWGRFYLTVSWCPGIAMDSFVIQAGWLKKSFEEAVEQKADKFGKIRT